MPFFRIPPLHLHPAPRGSHPGGYRSLFPLGFFQGIQRVAFVEIGVLSYQQQFGRETHTLEKTKKQTTKLVATPSHLKLCFSASCSSSPLLSLVFFSLVVSFLLLPIFFFKCRCEDFVDWRSENGWVLRTA